MENNAAVKYAFCCARAPMQPSYKSTTTTTTNSHARECVYARSRRSGGDRDRSCCATHCTQLQQRRHARTREVHYH